MPNEREDYLAEDNAVARECFKVLSPEAREAMTAGDICVLVGLAAEARRRGVKRYRAELTAPAEGDVEAAEKIVGEGLNSEENPIGELINKIAAALTTARKDAEARVKALEAENLGLRKTVGVDGKEIAELRAERDAAREAERKKCGLNLTFAAEGKGPLAGLGKMNPAKTIAELREQIADMKRGRELIPAEWAFVPMEPLLDAINAHIQARVKALEAAAREVVDKWNDLVCKGFLDSATGQPEWDEFVVRLNALAALLAGEGKGEEAEREEE